MPDPAAEPIRAQRCPICRKLTVERFRPFCSKRCADLDLARWFNGVYAVPVREDEAEAEPAAPVALPARSRGTPFS
ncbi:MAG: DNA gyrase inhibitor YacG [Hyphomicrobiales bacterium]|uniref:DNA gyrase inhibitor YacG n=1 Tax=Rhabdaerophilum calidifontis TaxID=2604328 RepID=UPI001239C93B|nr:DNA gyrase inhibitor YacG [Rhabdaerophilum calidifontis]MCA1951673.1 DNA gyrase inhibitor YacG [Hyphomicrobiales bacterium]MCA1999212.1 DNA gyrase inhibitor YacG [Hyphomicrobiales bacterium]